MSKFKIGDKVKNTLSYQTFTIKEVKDDSYAVEENVYLWSDEFLIPVKKTKPLKEITEKELAEMGYVIKKGMTPKEALEAIRKELQDRLDFPIDQTPEYRLVKQSLNELEDLKKPLTVDEMCETLKDFFKSSKYHSYIDTVYYSDKGEYFYAEDFETRNLIEMIFDSYYIHEIPPRLIKMIGGFYEGLEK